MATTLKWAPDQLIDPSIEAVEQSYHKNEGYDNREDVNATYDQLVKLGLTEQALELEIKGLTLIPPEKVAPLEFMAKCRHASASLA